MKSESFMPYLKMPALAGPRFEVAVGGTKAYDILSADGWKVSDPLRVARDPEGYREFIRCSKAEFTVAKHGYVTTNSGWFSERSAAYLASGRPVVAQDTGFSAWLPTGRGVHAFRTVEEACLAVEMVDCEYERECTAARATAIEFFDSNKVLPLLIERALNTSVEISSIGRPQPISSPMDAILE
jgi:hypothetical protein